MEKKVEKDIKFVRRHAFVFIEIDSSRGEIDSGSRAFRGLIEHCELPSHTLWSIVTCPVLVHLVSARPKSRVK